MKCEILFADRLACGETATMWVRQPLIYKAFPPWEGPERFVPQPVMSCDDCGPQLGYKTLAPLTTNIRSRD